MENIKCQPNHDWFRKTSFYNFCPYCGARLNPHAPSTKAESALAKIRLIVLGTAESKKTQGGQKIHDQPDRP